MEFQHQGFKIIVLVLSIIVLARKENDLQINKLLQDLNILHLIGRNIQGLSGGEMQKVALARMLVTNPKIMLMDEPLAHLDMPTRRILRMELRRILVSRSSVSSIYVTHFEEDVYALADQVAILKDGLVEDSNKMEFILSNQNQNRYKFISNMFEEANYLEGEVVRSKFGISTFSIGSNMIEILGEYSIGSRVGILIKPEDIILSRETIRTSARNMIKTKIIKMFDHDDESGTRGGGGVVDVHLKADRFNIRSRVTKHTTTDLDLQNNEDVFAIFKASSPQIIREH